MLAHVYAQKNILYNVPQAEFCGFAGFRMISRTFLPANTLKVHKPLAGEWKMKKIPNVL